MAEIRLQKFLSECSVASRRKSEELIRDGKVWVNGKKASIGDKVDPKRDDVTVNGKKVTVVKQKYYIMLNKPQGVISATEDRTQKTVLDLVPKELYRNGLFPAGRLDGDTTGFVLLTDDGDFAHRILSPKNHIMKTYHAALRDPLTDEDIEKFKENPSIQFAYQYMNNTPTRYMDAVKDKRSSKPSGSSEQAAPKKKRKKKQKKGA